MNEIKITSTKTSIVINIPVDLLIHCAKHHPEGELKVTDRNAFIKAMIEELQEQDADTGLTNLQQNLDDCMVRVAESGNDGTYYK